MQDTYKKIFQKAILEGLKVLAFPLGEKVIFYKGFRISLSPEGVYEWKDVRFSEYYEDVDPIITEKVLENGFMVTLDLVMIHNAEDKVISIKRDINTIDREVEHWVKEASKEYNSYKKKVNELSSKTHLPEENRNERKAQLKKRLDYKLSLFLKKRGVLKEEKDLLKTDLDFYENKIKLFKNN